MKYSVLLLCPDYLQENGDDTFYEFVDASDPATAVEMARAKVTDANNPTDLALLLVLEGHCRDLRHEVVR